MRAVRWLVTKAASTRPVTFVLARTHPHLDRLVHRLSGGRTTFTELVFPTLMLTTTGRRSGRPRTTPLMYGRVGAGFVVAGTNYGQEHHPDWTANLLADPDATAEVDGRTLRVRARRAGEEELPRLWEVLDAVYGGYRVYRRRIRTRDVRVFVLEPVDDRAPAASPAVDRR